MRTTLTMLALAALSAVTTGCTMCDTAHLHDYGGVGGKWQRGNPTWGRVGSSLSDAGAAEVGSAIYSGSLDGAHSGSAPFGSDWEELQGQPSIGLPPEFSDGAILLDESFGSETYIMAPGGSSPRFMDGEIYIGP
jgi:hypothetical protein